MRAAVDIGVEWEEQLIERNDERRQSFPEIANWLEVIWGTRSPETGT